MGTAYKCKIRKVTCYQCKRKFDIVVSISSKGKLHELCLDCNNTSISTIIPQSWVTLQKRITDPARMNPKGEVEAQDRIETEKKHELATNPKARSWEEGRKREWKANKPYYLKQFQQN